MASGVVTGIRFGVVDTRHVVAQGIPITEKQMYHKNGRPRVGGLADPSMAPPNRETLCPTCKNPLDTCPGHMGHIQLPITVYQAVFMKEVLRLLYGTCCVCARLLLPDDVLELKVPGSISTTEGGMRMGRDVLTACRKKAAVCGHCACPQPSKYLLHGFTVRRLWDADRLAALKEHCKGRVDTLATLTREFNAGDAADTLTSMAPGVWDTLRMARDTGAYLCTRHITVLSPKECPTVVKAEGSRTFSQDDMRMAFAAVQRHAHSVEEKVARQGARYTDAQAAVATPLLSPQDWAALGMPGGAVADRTHTLAMGVQHVDGDTCAAIHAVAVKECLELQQAVAALLTTEALSEQERQRSKRMPQHLRERLVSKTGRMRHDVNGVRVNHAGRAVVTASTLLELHQVGVPQCMAVVFTVQDRVHARNEGHLRECVGAGHGVLNGATHVDTARGRTYHLRSMSAERRAALRLRHGDIVRRHLTTGDWVLLNRQPTLHRASIMAMQCVLIPGRSIKFRVTCTPPFNADFDGDEMNLHVLQTVASRAEAAVLMGVPQNLTSPQHNGVNIFPAQDEMLALRELSRADTVLDAHTVAHLWGTLTPSPALAHALRLVRPSDLPALPPISAGSTSGRALLQCLLPRLTLSHDGVVVVHGRLDPASAPYNRGAMVALIRNSCAVMGQDATAAWLSNLTRLASAWLTRCVGASCGPRDIAVRPDTAEVCRAAVAALLLAAQRAAGVLRDRVVHPTLRAEGEAVLVTALAGATDLGFRAVQRDVHEGNSVMMRMVAAKSKGSKLNVTQLKACLGQQIVTGARPGKRGEGAMTLPHFAEGSTDPAAHGFVDRGFQAGLRPTQFFFHMMGALEGLVDTAVSTADVGYLQRRLGQGMNGHVVLPCGAVGDFSGVTLQLAYGGDGMEPQRLQRIPAPWDTPAANDALLHPVPEAHRFLQQLAGEYTDLTHSVLPGGTEGSGGARVPMSVSVWLDSELWHSAPSTRLSGVPLTKFEYAAALSRRVHALEQNAPGMGGCEDERDCSSAFMGGRTVDIAQREMRSHSAKHITALRRDREMVRIDGAAQQCAALW